MNILNRVKNFHPGPVCKAVVLFVVLFGLALVFGILPIEYNRKEDASLFWVNVFDTAWILLFLASWIQLIRVDKIFKRTYPNKPGFLAKPAQPVRAVLSDITRRVLMVVFMTLAVILLLSSCVLWCAASLIQ